MKKVSIILMAVAMVTFSACGNKKKSAQQTDQNQEASFEQVQLEAFLQVQLDSLAEMFVSKAPTQAEQDFLNGKIVIPKEVKQIKPTYLINPDNAQKLTSLAQKYRAASLLFFDKKVAELYDMNTSDYKAALTKLITDINDSAFKEYTNSDDLSPEGMANRMKALYEAEKKNGRLDLFWEMNGAAAIEMLYIATRTPEHITKHVSDDDAATMTFRTFLIAQSVEQLVPYYPGLETMSKALEPLKVLNAMDASELKDQLIEMKGEIEVIRNSLLK